MFPRLCKKKNRLKGGLRVFILLISVHLKATGSLTDCKATLSNCHCSKGQSFSNVSSLLAASVLTERQNKNSDCSLVSFIEGCGSALCVKSIRTAESYITAIKLVTFSKCMFRQARCLVLDKT